MSESSSRILMITPFHSSQRGNSLTTARLKKGLESRGFTIDLLSLEQNDATTQLNMALEQRKYALIHAFNTWYWARLLEENPHLEYFPVLLTTTGTDIHYDLYGSEKALIENAFQSARHIVLFHQDFADNIVRLYPTMEEKLRVIPQGIYLPTGVRAERSQLNLNENDFVFLLPSGLRPVKNIALAIDALEKLQTDYPELQLLIIGARIAHDYSQSILERIAGLPWARYLGELPHEEIAGIMRLGDVVLNTSTAEGQPQAALEAMSLGKPCILTAVPGNLNIIESGREGFYVENEAELIQAARTLISDHNLSKKMGRAAQQLVEENFDLEKELNAYADLYRQLI